MNSRIQELKNQCWVEKHWDKEKERWIDRHIDLDKFAELIVRECAEVARLNTRIDSKLYLMIKQHFGVEE